MSLAEGFWNDQQKAQKMMRERSSSEETIKEFERVESEVKDLLELLELAAAEDDEGVIADVAKQLPSLEAEVRNLELKRMLTADDDTYFHYAHLSEFATGIELGSEVVAGQIIGYVGSTGNSSTPHLHFEYHPFGGSAVNPYSMVKSIDACKVTELLPQPTDS